MAIYIKTSFTIILLISIIGIIYNAEKQFSKYSTSLNRKFMIDLGQYDLFTVSLGKSNNIFTKYFERETSSSLKDICVGCNEHKHLIEEASFSCLSTSLTLDTLSVVIKVQLFFWSYNFTKSWCNFTRSF